MGRKQKELNDEQIAQVEALAAYLSVEQIADFFGIAKNTFYSLMERNPEIKVRYKKGQAKAIGSVAKSLVQEAQNGNMTAMIFYLKTRGGWKETQTVDLNLSDENKPKVYKSLKELFDDNDEE